MNSLDSLRQNMVMLTGLLWIIALAWLFLLSSSFAMKGMLPSAMPMILTFSGIYKKQKEKGSGFVPTWIFVFGYLAVWALFAIIVAGAQWLLATQGLLSMMAIANPLAAGAIIIIAGIYQLTPLKDLCLRKCQSPFDFLMTGWREGRKGALVMGANHGRYCLGCCWALMILLFAAGIMNLMLIAIIATFVVVEKLLPPGHWGSRAAGVALILIGTGVAAVSFPI
ncbi:MAG: DUF2182 domain-containing protein [Candidatus Aenigmarchaeota archaeon]|nr:DUF2182 domain-containing protein [Candidatus Aenigmarchaeota archaeon]